MDRINDEIQSKKKHPLFPIYQGIMTRCYNPKSESYKYYGSRGIKVCDEWQTFEGFCEWAKTHPRPEGTSIDRIDVNGNYEPTNCRWATIKEQNRNKRNNVYIEYQGQTKTLCEWSEILNINKFVLFQRIKRGCPAERLFDPVEKRNMTSRKTVEKICKELQSGLTHKEIAKHFNVDVGVVSRIATGNSFKDISSKYVFSKKGKKMVEKNSEKKALSGKDVWSLIAPIIAPHGGVNDDGKISMLDEAYVLVFSALKYWDENHKESDDD